MAQTVAGVIQASGGVLWRPSVDGAGVEVGLVHRPKYDDWSVPKGKLQRSEHVVLAALREVAEETGFTAVPGQPMGSIEYLKDGAPKEVHYWAMRLSGGEFVPNEEVDRMMWLPPREAMAHVLPERDRPILERFAATFQPTRLAIVVRHASAGDRDSWPGEDHDRPLDETGKAQAQVLSDLFEAYDVTRLLSADVLRCIETVGPYATRRRLTVLSEPLFSESGSGEHRQAAEDRLLEVLSDPEATVVCTQRALLAGVVQAATQRLGATYGEPDTFRKGDLLVLHLTTDGSPKVLAIEHLSPSGVSPTATSWARS